MLKGLMDRGAEHFKKKYGGDVGFLGACVSAVAMVINADGQVDEAEKKAAIQGLTTHKIIGEVYAGSEIERALSDAIVDGSTRAGRAKLERALETAAKRDVQDREDIFLIAADVADQGGVGDKEKASLAKIAKALDVNGDKLFGEKLPEAA